MGKVVIQTKQFVENMKLIRMSKGLTSEALAKLAGFSRIKAVADYECGRGGPELQEIIDISKVLGVKIDDMLNKKATATISFTEVSNKEEFIPDSA